MVIIQLLVIMGDSAASFDSFVGVLQCSQYNTIVIESIDKLLISLS